MRLARRVAKILLSIFVLCEAYFAWQLWRHGPPMMAIDVREIKPGEESFRMIPVPLTAHDYLELIVVIA